MNYDNNKNRCEERVFSIIMTEEEIALFSEFLEQREYARGVVSKMNPNMVRRRVVNGKTVTKMSAGSAPSTKQVRDAQVQRKAAEKVSAKISRTKERAPKPKYESRDWRTQETAESAEARAQHDKRVEKLEKNSSKRQHQVASGMKRKEREGVREPKSYVTDAEKGKDVKIILNDSRFEDAQSGHKVDSLRDSIKTGKLKNYKTRTEYDSLDEPYLERYDYNDPSEYYGRYYNSGGDQVRYDRERGKSLINARINRKAGLSRELGSYYLTDKDHAINPSNYTLDKHIGLEAAQKYDDFSRNLME